MIKKHFYTYKDFRVDWEVDSPDKFIREIVLTDSVHTCLEKMNLFSLETGNKMPCIPSKTEIRNEILTAILDARGDATASGSITTQTIDLDLCATINKLKFCNNPDAPLQVTVDVSKYEYCYAHRKLLQQIIVFYNPINKSAWIGDGDMSVSLLQNDGVEETICAFVKENMDKVFSGSVEAEELLVQIVLQANGIIIETHTSHLPIAVYRGNNHYLDLPLRCSYLGSEVDRLPFTKKQGMLESTLLTSLYAARNEDPAFVVSKYYVQKIHEDGKRDSRKFVRTFQELLSSSLTKAEEQYLIVKTLFNE